MMAKDSDHMIVFSHVTASVIHNSGIGRRVPSAVLTVDSRISSVIC